MSNEDPILTPRDNPKFQNPDHMQQGESILEVVNNMMANNVSESLLRLQTDATDTRTGESLTLVIALRLKIEDVYKLQDEVIKQ